jgi:anti-anti-sigma factor
MKLTLLPLADDNVIRVQCEGFLTTPHMTPGGDPLEGLLGRNCYTHKVLFNMEQVRSIDTSGVCWLLRVIKQFREAGGRFVIYSVPGIVLNVLDVLHLTATLPMATDETAARELATKPEGGPTLERFPRREPGPADGTRRSPG